MQSVLIHYFSGTGNTYHAVSLIGIKLEASGYSVKYNRIEYGTVPPEGIYDLHVFAFPVYAMDVPEIMLRYLRKVSPGNGVRAVVLAIYGRVYDGHRFPGDQGDPGSSYDHARNILERKGYEVFLTGGAGYPHSITQIIQPPGKCEANAITSSSDIKICEFADRIIAGQKDTRKPGLVTDLISYPFGAAYGNIGRRFLGKMLIADNNCTSCGKCIRSCPAGAIAMKNKKPVWNWNCQGCQRCINLCPAKAIQTSVVKPIVHWIGIPVLLAALWLMGFYTTYSLMRPSGDAGILYDLLIFFALWAVLIPITDILMLAMEQVPALRRIMSLSFTGGYRRYICGDFNPVSKTKSRKI